jgi:hypothetical protein
MLCTIPAREGSEGGVEEAWRVTGEGAAAAAVAVRQSSPVSLASPHFHTPSCLLIDPHPHLSDQNRR